MLELFASPNIYFHDICIQDFWFADESNIPLFVHLKVIIDSL